LPRTKFQEFSAKYWRLRCNELVKRLLRLRVRVCGEEPVKLRYPNSREWLRLLVERGSPLRGQPKCMEQPRGWFRAVSMMRTHGCGLRPPSAVRNVKPSAATFRRASSPVAKHSHSNANARRSPAVSVRSASATGASFAHSTFAPSDRLSGGASGSLAAFGALVVGCCIRGGWSRRAVPASVLRAADFRTVIDHLWWKKCCGTDGALFGSRSGSQRVSTWLRHPL
jgi:hypothetical protein